MAAFRLTSVKDYKNVLDSYDTWLFDCDGVLWHDVQVIEGVIEVLGILRRQGENSKELQASGVH